MGTISKEGAGCFWSFWGICGIVGGIRIIFEGQQVLGAMVALIVGLLIIAGSILFIKYAGRAFWKIFKK